MLAYGKFIVDRLYENGDIQVPSSKDAAAESADIETP
jgi:hypothetical protein